MSAYEDSSAIFLANPNLGIDKFHLDGTFFSGWPYEQGGLKCGGTAVVVDIDHDGYNEVVAVGVDSLFDRWLMAVDDNGLAMPGFPIHFDGSLMTPNVADFDADGEYEIITLSFQPHYLYCFDRFGNYKPGWPISVPDDMDGSFGACGAVGDLDLDGYLEFLIQGDQYLYCYRYDATEYPGFPIRALGGEPWWYNDAFGPTLGDIDFDGFLEIMVAGDNFDPENGIGFVAVYEHDLTMKPGWPLLMPDWWAHEAPVVADIDNNGTLELGFASGALTYFVDIDAQSLPGWPRQLHNAVGQPYVPRSDIIVVDLDSDGDCEIFGDFNVVYADSVFPDTIFWGYSYLLGFDRFGNELPGFPIETNGHCLLRPPVFAMDSLTHRLYMGLFTELDTENIYVDSSYTEVYRFPDSTGPPDQWPMLGHDNLMTRNYNFVDNVTGIDETNPPLPKSYVLKQNYPNPFNSATIIEFALPKEEEISFVVYDVLGRKVAELAEGVYPAGNHRLTWNASEYATGVYFCVLQTPGISISRKMVVVK